MYCQFCLLALSLGVIGRLCSVIVAISGHLLYNFKGPDVRSIVSLTSSLTVKMLTVLVSTISNSQVFLLKNVQMQKLHTFFFSINISIMPY